MSEILDTRTLNEELEELESLVSDQESAKEELDAANDALTDYVDNGNFSDDYDFDSDDKHYDLTEAVSDAEDVVNDIDLDEDELEELRSLKDEVGGEWEYGTQLIPEDEFVDYCKQMLEDCGDLPTDIPDYIVIDWDETASNLRVDYSETEFRGETYLFRS
jgi:hypothetical protein